MNEKDKSIKQAEFCQQMMNRIVGDVMESSEYSYYRGMRGYTRMQSDITHLRRELLRLSKIVGGE